MLPYPQICGIVGHRGNSTIRSIQATVIQYNRLRMNTTRWAKFSTIFSKIVKTALYFFCSCSEDGLKDKTETSARISLPNPRVLRFQINECPDTRNARCEWQIRLLSWILQLLHLSKIPRPSCKIKMIRIHAIAHDISFNLEIFWMAMYTLFLYFSFSMTAALSSVWLFASYNSASHMKWTSN